jgi:copper chaperone CopZ
MAQGVYMSAKKSLNFEIPNMRCSSCEKKIRAKFESSPIDSLDFDIDGRSLVVSFDPEKFTSLEAKKSLEELGFEIAKMQSL